MLTGQCRRCLGKPYSKDQDTLPSLPRNSFESNGNFPQIESAAFPHSCQPTLAPDSDPITYVSCYSHVGDLLHICEGYWQPTFGKEYLQQGLFSATLEGL